MMVACHVSARRIHGHGAGGAARLFVASDGRGRSIGAQR